MTTPPRRLRRTLLAAPALLLALLAAGCSGGADNASSMSADSEAGTLDVPEAATVEAPAEAQAMSRNAAADGKQASGGLVTTTSVRRAAVIRTGDVSLRSKDVGALRFDVQKELDVLDATVTDEDTQTDRDGAVVRSRLVVRVAEAEFDEAMDALEGVGDLISSKRASEDVTTQVIDHEVRIRAQRASVRRIEQLLSRATSIRDIVAIESQLTSRQAELDSLEQQLAWLSDQTSFSTIRVHLERTAAPVKKEQPDEAGFLAGLEQGWTWLKGAATDLSTVVGRLLPVSIVLLALGYPVLWFLRRRRPDLRTVRGWTSASTPADPPGSPS